MKKIFNLVFIFIFIGLNGHANMPSKSPLTTPNQRPRIGPRCSLKIDQISPRRIYPGNQIIISYSLKFTVPMRVSTVPIKIRMYIDDNIKFTDRIEDFPNDRETRLEISTKAPYTSGSHTIRLQIVRDDADIMRAKGREVLATQTKNFIVLKKLIGGPVIVNTEKLIIIGKKADPLELGIAERMIQQNDNVSVIIKDKKGDNKNI